MRRTGDAEKSAAGSAGRLAARIERECSAGISWRSVGRCTCARPGAQAGRRVRHDRGCATLGVSLRHLHKILRAEGHGGAAEMLGEAIEDAVAEIALWGAAWDPVVAQEAIGEAIRSRITPRG